MRSTSPVEMGRTLHGVLDTLLTCDLTSLSASEHSELVTSLVALEQRLHAATLDAVAAFDAVDVASLSRHRTTKRWLEHRTRLSPGSASRMVGTSRALRDHLPATRDALASGRVTAAHVSAITRVVRTVGAEHASTAEPILLDLARRFDPAAVARATSAIFAEVDPVGAEKALQAAYEKRGLTLSVVGEHGYLDGVFDLESTEMIRTALQPLMSTNGPADRRSVPQMRADAFLDVVGKHLDTADDVPSVGGHRPHLSVVIDAAQLPPADVGAVGAPNDPASGAADRASVDTVAAGQQPESGVGQDGEPRGWAGTITLPWTGAAIPASVARRWACHATITPLVSRLLGRRRGASGPPPRVAVDPAWVPMAVGRTQRTATAAQLKALTVRDGGCIHPGCSRTAAYCDAHHVVHWADGGPTDVRNMVLLCRHHHRTLHQGQWAIHPDPGSPGLFWTTDSDGLHQAQTSSDRSPPPARTHTRDPVRTA